MKSKKGKTVKVTEGMQAKAYRLEDKHINHIAKKIGKNGIASEYIRGLIDADMAKDAKSKHIKSIVMKG